ncbi:sodium/hydrogen exchanger protein [Moesziomyces antarcticus T-34]|uniref:Sodium/hydrogen exchanger protein n=1 Tax=Pseudozyma antarctica (strain T-34) TaxID=1151754 RepID=M9M6K8_PSEA3|nr:sodium/hydrogen exchanger protein [Moesziomyces antarcticus T-34]
MSRDPYHDFASDLKSSLASARSLSESYRQLVARSAASSASGAGGSSSRRTSSEIDSAHDRLSDAIEGLRQDVEDVKQSVAVVERSGPERFGVTPDELRRRKAFVEECEAEIKALSKVVKQSAPDGRRGGSGFDSVKIDVDGQDEDATEAFEREQQQILMSRQDSTLDKIGTTLNSLRNQAGMMGQEIGEQIEIIDAFDGEVEQSQGRLGKAMRKMDEVVRISDERLGGWCVWILIVVLFLLLLVVFLI